MILPSRDTAELSREATCTPNSSTWFWAPSSATRLRWWRKQRRACRYLACWCCIWWCTFMRTMASSPRTNQRGCSGYLDSLQASSTGSDSGKIHERQWACFDSHSTRLKIFWCMYMWCWQQEQGQRFRSRRGCRWNVRSAELRSQRGRYWCTIIAITECNGGTRGGGGGPSLGCPDLPGIL